MGLRALVIADPVEAVAALLGRLCVRLAAQVVTASDGAAAQAQVARLRPEVVVVSLELPRPGPDALVPALRALVPQALLLGSYRELSMPRLARLRRLGIDDFLAQPVDAGEIYRAVALRHGTPYRQYPRHEVGCDVWRADGPLLGRTLNLSEGGMRLALTPAMAALPAIAPEQSFLVELALPDAEPTRLRTRWRVLMRDGHPPETVLARGTFENLRGSEQQRLLRFLAGLPRLQAT